MCSRVWLYFCSPGFKRSSWVACVWTSAHECVHTCVGHWKEGTRCSQGEHWRYATHVKFMFCAPFTKKSLNGFWGKIMLKQWEDGAEDNKADKKQSGGRGQRKKDTTEEKVNVLSRRENEKKWGLSPWTLKGLSEVKLRFQNLFAAKPSPREIQTACCQAWAALQTESFDFPNDWLYHTEPKHDEINFPRSLSLL